MTKNHIGEQNSYDIFIADRVFPEADAIFATKFEPLETVKDEALIILDTNVLLLPYTTSKESLEQIKQTYNILVSQKRLIIPAQVAREFANNRSQKIAELFQQLNRKKSKIGNLHDGNYPLLESLDDYQEASRIEKEINDKLTEYQTVINRILDHIRDWRWNDPVSLMYGELFDRTVISEPQISEEDLLKDL
jgi:rRNA-processing protein FCF1